MSAFENSSTFYVSQMSGKNSFSGLSPTSDGHSNGPFKSVERAIEAIKTQRAHGCDRPLTVCFTDDYYTDEPILISGIDAVTFESFGKRKRIIGGVRIDGWRESSFNGRKCLKAQVPDGIEAAFTDLYVNEKRASVTRFPKEGTLRIIDADHVCNGDERHIAGSSKWFRVRTEDLRGLECIEDAIINYNHYWIDEHSPIESYDRESGMLVMTYHSRFSVSTDYERRACVAPNYHLTHIPNAFTEKGNWYLDRASRTVYYLPLDGEDASSIEAFAPISKKLFIIEGEDIRIRNLELTCNCGDYVSTVPNPNTPEGVTQFASDKQSVCYAHGAVTFQRANRCEISRCEIHGVGIYGLEIASGCHHIRIENNHIYDTCAGAVRAQGGNSTDDVANMTSSCIIRGNHIHDCGKRYLAGCGILIIDASHFEISENEIHDIEYSGISVGWIWGYDENTAYGHLIKGNHVYNIGKGNLSDLGGIYLLGRQKGTVVCENRIHDVRCADYGAFGIYLDEGSSYTVIEKNVVYRTGSECFHLHYGMQNTVRNNIFWGEKGACLTASKGEAHEQILLTQNIFIVDGAPIFGAMGWNAGAFGNPDRYRSDGNLLFDLTNGEPIMWRDREKRCYSLDEWHAMLGKDTHSISAAPAFEDLFAFDFTLKEDSPAFSLGFEALPKEIAKGK